MLQSNKRIVKHKVGLLNLTEELSNVSKACKIMGLSRVDMVTDGIGIGIKKTTTPYRLWLYNNS